MHRWSRATAGGSDLLRKAIGKKKREIMVAEGEKFIRRCTEHGTSKKKAQELWSLIEPFARYGFNKSHAVAYALVAYKTAYLKAHHPIDFFAANLSAEIGSTDGIVKVLGDCQESGISVLPPDINESATSFAAVGDAIRFGLAAIKGVGEAAAQAILTERRARPFASFTDFAMRLDSHLVNKRTLDALIAAGAFDSLGRNRATLAAASERVARAVRTREDVEQGQSNLFSAATADQGPPADDFPEQPDWALDERLKGEKDTLGFYVTGHPLTRFSLEIERFAEARIAELAGRVDQTVRIAGVLASLKKQKIKKGLNEGKTMLKAMSRTRAGASRVHLRQPLREGARLGARRPPGARHSIVREAGGAGADGSELRPSRASASGAPASSRSDQPRLRRRERPGAPAGAARTARHDPVSFRLVRPGEFEATLRPRTRCGSAVPEPDPRDPGAGGRIGRVRLLAPPMKAPGLGVFRGPGSRSRRRVRWRAGGRRLYLAEASCGISCRAIRSGTWIWSSRRTRPAPPTSVRELARELSAAARPHGRFGTAVLTLPDGERLDVAAARRETYASPGALPAVAFPAGIEEDLARRDFTVNAMALALSPGRRPRLVDPYGGLVDLERGTLRALHVASFVDDPTRALRAVRYANRYGFRLDAATRRAIARAVEDDAFDRVSGDRLRRELVKLFGEPRRAAAVRLLRRLGLDRAIAPALARAQGEGARLRAVEALAPEGREAGWLAYLLAWVNGLSSVALRSVADRIALAGDERGRLLAWPSTRRRLGRGLARRRVSEIARRIAGLSPDELLAAPRALSAVDPRALANARQRLAQHAQTPRGAI
jgi:hypothetical protein